MGQEERKNKARLEKAQMGLTNSNAEYDTAIKALEKTTERWNRDWKAACDVGPRICNNSDKCRLTVFRNSKIWRKSESTS